MRGFFLCEVRGRRISASVCRRNAGSSLAILKHRLPFSGGHGVNHLSLGDRQVFWYQKPPPLVSGNHDSSREQATSRRAKHRLLEMNTSLPCGANIGCGPEDVDLAASPCTRMLVCRREWYPRGPGRRQVLEDMKIAGLGDSLGIPASLPEALKHSPTSCRSVLCSPTGHEVRRLSPYGPSRARATSRPRIRRSTIAAGHLPEASGHALSHIPLGDSRRFHRCRSRADPQFSE